MVGPVTTRPEGRPVLGVFGGSFDPPHLGHALVPAYLRVRGLVDAVLVAPVADHPFGKQMRPFAERLLLTRMAMALSGLPTRQVEVTDLEDRLAREHGGPSRTLRLLEAVEAARPEMRVRLVVGSDIVADGQTAKWHRWDEIERRFPPIVVPRTGVPGETSVCALPAISSSEVRAWIEAWHEHGRREDRARLEASLPAGVAAHVLAARRIAAGAGRVVWVVGRGHVARHAVPWLRGRGWSVVEVGARALVGAALDPDTQQAMRTPPEAIWVLAADPAIGDVAKALVGLGLPTHVPVLHGAGALRAHDALAELAGAGHPVGTLHPICSLRKERPWPSDLPRAGFGLEGDAPAKAVALGWLGAQPHLDLDGFDAGMRRAYHAACALAANHLAVLQEEAATVLVEQGHEPDTVRAVLVVLLESALANLVALGVPAGITGPVSRGDVQAVQGHLAALPEHAATLYRVLSDRLTAILTRSSGRA